MAAGREHALVVRREADVGDVRRVPLERVAGCVLDHARVVEQPDLAVVVRRDEELAVVLLRAAHVL